MGVENKILNIVFKYVEDLHTTGISNDILGKFYSHLHERILKKEDKDII